MSPLLYYPHFSFVIEFRWRKPLDLDLGHEGIGPNEKNGMDSLFKSFIGLRGRDRRCSVHNVGQCGFCFAQILLLLTCVDVIKVIISYRDQ